MHNAGLSKITITQIPDSSIGTLTLNGKTLENNAEIPTGDLDKLIFKPTANYSGDVTFKYKGSDGYLNTNESTVTIKVNPLNDAPVLTADQTLQAINEDITNTDNIGQTIASIITDGTITDVDGNPIEAIAITSVNNSYGTWQYSTNGGTSWTPISNTTGAKVSLSSKALLLDSNSLVRFIPNENFFGTSTFEFRAWDKSSGIVGGTTDPYLLGGNSSVSAEVKTASITINAINDIPTTENKTIEINEDEAYVFTLGDFKFNDVDKNDVLTSVKIESLPSFGVIKLNGKAVSEGVIITKANIDAGLLTYITAQDGFGKPYTTFTFSVNDGTANSIPATITLNATDTNDAPTAIAWASGGSVAEDKISTSSVSTIVGKLSATDPNTGDTLRFVQLSNNKFVINPDGTVKLAISPKDLSGNNVALLDYELNPTETIKVKVIDSQGLSYETNMTVTVEDVFEKTPSLYTNVLYATKGNVTTLTESQIRTVDADTKDGDLIYTVKQEIVGGKLFIDNGSNGTTITALNGVYDEGYDTLLGPESEETPEYKANFTHADVVAGKIKFYKDDTQTNAKISLSVTDGNSSDEGLVVVIVSNPPVLSAPIEVQEWGISGTQSFTIPASTFTDADFDILTYSAKLSNGDPLPSWLSFDSKTGKFSGTPIGMNDGDTISITVTATDGRTTPATDTFIITFEDSITKPILANPLPEYIEFNGSGNKEYSIPADTFSNPLANTTLTYTATLGNGNALPSWLSFDPTTQKFSGNPPASAVGEPLIIKITANNGTTTSTTIKLYVSDSNDIPVNSATISDKVITDSNTYTYTILKSTFTDGDGDPITLSLTTKDGTELPSWIKYSTDSNGDLIITAKAPAGAGTENLRVIGRDGFGGESISNFKITYSGGANESPQVRTSEGIFYMENGSLKTSSYGALEKFSILAGKTATITTTYLDENDPDDDGIGLTYTLVNEPLYGQLWLDIDGSGTINGSEKTLNSGDTFTQKDIDDKKLKYKHTALNTTDDKFVFNLRDGGENASAEVKGVTFNIDVLANPTELSMISVKRYIPIDALTNENEVKFKVKFNAVTYGVDKTDFIVTGSGNSGATISKVEYIASNEYMVSVSGITANDGTLGLKLATTPTIITTGGSAIDTEFVTPINEIFILDNTAPSVTITPDRTIYAGTTPFNGTLVFSEKVTNLTLEDIKAVNATISNLTQIDDKNFSFVITPNGDKESIILNFANAMVNDIAGNENSLAQEVIITRNSSSTISNTKIIDSNTINGTTPISPLFPTFDNTDLSNIEKSNGLKSLNITIPSDSIKDGENEKLTIGNKTIPLNFQNNDVIENVNINGVEYKIKAIVVDGNSTLVFEKNDGSIITPNEAKDLIDSIKYNNNSTTPTNGDRIFSLSIENSTERKFTEIDGIDTKANDIYLFSEVYLGDTDSSQGLQSLKISIPTASILDGVKEELIVNGTVIPLNFINGKAIANITLSGVEYKISAIVIDGNSTLVFKKESGKISFTEAEALLDVIKYNNSSDEPTTTLNRQFNLVLNDGLEDSSASIVTVKIESTNDTPVISVETGNSEKISLTESNTTLKANGTLSIMDLDSSQTVSVSTVGVVATQKDSTNTNMTSSSSQPSNETLLAMLGFNSKDVINSTSTTGTINWVFNSGTEAFDYLAVGETLTLTYTVKATDSASPDSTNQTILITITGTNDKPNITASTVTALNNSDSTAVTASGNLSFSDVDTTDVPKATTTVYTPSTTNNFTYLINFDYTAVRAIGGGSITLDSGAITALQNALLINQTGSVANNSSAWSYTLDATTLKDNSKTLILAGDKVTAKYTVTIADENGGSITKDLEFTFIGTGTSASLIVNGDAGSIVEGTKLSDAGSITFNGQEVITTATINATENITASSLTLTTAQKTAIKNAFAISVADNVSTDAVNWTFNISETNLDFLPAGETVKAVFIVDIYDNSSTPVKIGTQNVTILITGANDAPVISSSVSDARGSLTEVGNNVAGTGTASGTLTSSDVDSGATKTWSITGINSTAETSESNTFNSITYDAKIVGIYGTLYLEKLTGKWNYILDNDDSDTKALQTGDKVIEIFTATVSDGTATAQQTIIVEINGTNDAPVLTTPTTISYTDTNANDVSTITTQSGTLSSSDDESTNGDTKVFSISGQVADTTQSEFTHSKVGTYGTLYLNALIGTYKYIPNDAAIEALTLNTSETFDFTVTDSLGATDTQTLTISITATNDTPIISVGEGNSASDSLYETNSALTSSGTLTLTDLDKTQTVSVSKVGLSATGVIGSFSATDDSILLAMLSLDSGNVIDNSSIVGTINWVFNSNGFNNANLGKTFDYLAIGETLTLAYTIKATDSASLDSANQTIVITITGTNDAPIISLGTEDGVSATLTETNETLRVIDTLTVNEIEPNDTINANVESVSINSSSTVSSLAIPSNAILKAMLSLDKSSLLADTSATSEALTWTFDSGSEYFDKIASGETLVLDYVVKITDTGNPAKIDTKTITITINGSNDAPVIDTYALDDANINGIIESGKPLKLADTGVIVFSDIDFLNRPTATEVLKSITALRRVVDINTPREQFNLDSTQITNITNAFSISTPIDNTNNGIVNWEYAISQANVDFLGAGESVIAVFTVTVKDSTTGLSDTQDITITIAGENKTPTLSAETKNINEANANIVDTIAMTATDANMSDSLMVSIESGTYKFNSEAPKTMSSEQLAWLSLNTTTYPSKVVDGINTTSSTFNWDFNTNSTTFNELNTGETVTLVYTIKVIDNAPIPYESTKTVTVTITGTNDAPVAVVDVAETTENSAITIDVLANDIDADSADNSSNFTLKEASITTNSHSAGYNTSNVPLTQFATVSIVDNKLVFNPNSEFDYLAVGETASVVVTYTMSDNEGLTSTSTATITIKGTNDTPIITLEASDNASEDFVESINNVTTSGKLSLNDKDTTNTVTATVDSVVVAGTAQVGSKTNDYLKSMLTLNSENILNNTQNDGIITWNFDSKTDVFDYIAKDEVLILTYKIKALDSSNEYTTQDVVIKITGTNDSPILNTVLETTYTDTNVDDTFESYNGTLVANDVDISDIKTYSIAGQKEDIAQTGFTHSKLGNYGNLYINSVTGAYKYIPNDVKIEELTTNEVDEFTFSVTDDSQEINNIDSKIFRVNLLGVNDTPRVLGNNIDAKTSFGEVFNQETAYLFSDIDRGHILTFTTSKLPQGLSIDKNTGIISGRAVEPGNFTITITASDSGNPTLSVSRTFNLLVIAPPQNLSTDTTSTRNTNETAQQIVKEITVDRINDTITAFSSSSNSLIETIGTKNQVEQLLNSMNSNTLGGKNGSTNSNLDISRTELTSIGQTTSNNPNDKIITANANLNLDQTGKVNVNDKANQAFQTLGLTIEKISLAQEQIEVKLLDTRVGQKYSVTLANGNELPEGLSFDPNTGKIIGVLPEGVTELNISIKALSNDGTTRVLNLKIDLKELKKKQSAFNTLSEQVEKQSFKMSDYGSFINSLVSKAV